MAHPEPGSNRKKTWPKLAWNWIRRALRWGHNDDGPVQDEAVVEGVRFTEQLWKAVAKRADYWRRRHSLTKIGRPHVRLALDEVLRHPERHGLGEWFDPDRVDETGS